MQPFQNAPHIFLPGQREGAARHHARRAAAAGRTLPESWRTYRLTEEELRLADNALLAAAGDIQESLARLAGTHRAAFEAALRAKDEARLTAVAAWTDRAREAVAMMREIRVAGGHPLLVAPGRNTTSPDDMPL